MRFAIQTGADPNDPNVQFPAIMNQLAKEIFLLKLEVRELKTKLKNAD